MTDTLTPAIRERAPSPTGGMEPRTPSPRDRVAVPLALVALYFIWGSTYLAIRFTVETFPPFYAAGARFVVAGTILFVFLWTRGAPIPTAREWGSAAIVGALLLVGGNGLVSVAEQSVASGLAAVLVAAVPLWAGLFAWIWGHRPTKLEGAGLLIGFGGVALLNVGTSLHANPRGVVLLLLASTSWALGSVWSRSLRLPQGVMSASAQMLTGGVVLFTLGIASGERMSHLPTARGVWALIYLIVFGSLVAYVSYVFLLKTVRPALATSYAYVNPAVAVALGIVLNNEHLSPTGVFALVIILAAVALVVMGRRSS